MQVGFDGRSFFSGATGDRTYFRNLIAEMARLEPESKYTLYYRELDADREAFAQEHDNVRTAAVWHRVGWLWGQCAVAPRLRRDGIKVFNAQYMLPPLTPCPAVVTIHDITFRLFPQWNPPHIRRVRNILIPLAAHSAKRIITGSLCAKRDIVRHFKVRPDKVVVTPYAASPKLHPMQTEAAQAHLADRYNGLQSPYILGVGLRGIRKNPGVVVRAMRRLQKEGDWPSGARLALTGSAQDFPDPMIHEQSDHILFLGYVADEDLPALYSAAAACVYPSLYEGFGLPPLEAMACGCPVISSNTSSLPEVVGDAGRLLPPDDESAWASALSQLLTDENSRDNMRRKGLQRAAEFSWERTARQTLAIYDELTARG
jgi:glycosyltransferase involved in cell wall biosynthesis